jgi:hypothetical protein
MICKKITPAYSRINKAMGRGGVLPLKAFVKYNSTYPDAGYPDAD